MYSLYLVTDDAYEDNLAQQVEQAILGGVTLVQMRIKHADTLKLYEYALALKQVTERYRVPLIIDDRLDIAMAVDAAGVHLGQSDLPIAIARKLWCRDKIYGATTKTVEQALQAERDGATYLGVGAIFPTTTKVITKSTSQATLRAITQAVNIPVVAIGGIKHENINELSGQKIAGVAVVSGILAKNDPQQAARILREDLDRLL